VSLPHQRGDDIAHHTATAVLGQRRDAEDAGHGDRPAGEPLQEPELSRRPHRTVAVERNAEVLQGHP
jgi:hypothetical protein